MTFNRSERKIRRYHPPSSILRSRFKVEKFYPTKPVILRADFAPSAGLEPDKVSETTATSSVQIPKPKGSVGRPSRGGYQLATILDWELSRLNALQVRLFTAFMCLVMTPKVGLSQ